MNRATKVYRDNFVYNINTPLCETHAREAWKTRSPYAYLEECESGDPCSHCMDERRQRYISDNAIHWQLWQDGILCFESRDRMEFWRQVRTLKRDSPYFVREVWPDGSVHGGET